MPFAVRLLHQEVDVFELAFALAAHAHDAKRIVAARRRTVRIHAAALLGDELARGALFHGLHLEPRHTVGIQVVLLREQGDELGGGEPEAARQAQDVIGGQGEVDVHAAFVEA